MTTPDEATMPTSSMPVFGKRSTPFADRTYRQFALEVESTSERWEEPFDAYMDTDAGAIFRTMQSTDQLSQAKATANLLLTTLRDDDGVPAEWMRPREPVPLPDEQQPDDPSLPTLWETDDDGAPLFERWDGELVTVDGLAVDELQDGSSRRRFAHIMDAIDLRVELKALTQVQEWIVGDLAARPTQRPVRSQHGRSGGGRGSGGRQR